MLSTDPGFEGRLARLVELEAEPGDYAEPKAPIDPLLSARLAELGIERLYSHQAAAYDLAKAGQDVVVVTGTSSGKTLCYHLPTFDCFLGEPLARAFYLFPTKALAQDQVGKFLDLAPKGLARAGTYDGDTPQSQRSAVRNAAQVVLTNPDMLHVGILPHHETWSKFLKNLRFVIIDEMHAYGGIFGAHVCGVLRRLLRLAEWYGSRPQIIACSATIANPLQLFGNLTGRQASLVDSDGARKGVRKIALVKAADPESRKRTHNQDAAELLAELVAEGGRGLVFCTSRVGVELVLRHARKALEKRGLPPGLVDSYRAGYTPKERRQIEKALFGGKLRGLATTNAMELGVDVGGLDVAILAGYPGTISSFWQQSGRAGRSGLPGLSVLLAHADPLEAFLVREPRMLLDRGVESVAASRSNPHVLAAQLRCASYERALSTEDLEAFSPEAPHVSRSLEQAGDMTWSAGRYFYPSHDSPARKVNIRSMDSPMVVLRTQKEALGTMELWRALRSAHPGAIYLHRGDSFRVESLDLASFEAWLTEDQPDHFTRPVLECHAKVTFDLQGRRAPPYHLRLVAMHVSEVVVGYRKMALDGATVIDEYPLDLPTQEYDTIGVRLDLPQELVSDGDVESIGAIHALEHALSAVGPLLVGCDRRDLGSIWGVATEDTLAPAIWAYDTIPGGVGLAEALFEQHRTWLAAASSLLESCPCEEGCPACLLSATCASANNLLSKPGARALLGRLDAAFSWE